MDIFAIAQHSGDTAKSTGTHSNGMTITEVGTTNARVRVEMNTKGEFTIQVVDMFGDIVGDLGALPSGKRRRTLTAKLPKSTE